MQVKFVWTFYKHFIPSSSRNYYLQPSRSESEHSYWTWWGWWRRGRIWTRRRGSCGLQSRAKMEVSPTFSESHPKTIPKIKFLETDFALRLCLELRWELRLFPIIRYKVGVVLCWCWRCWMEVSGQHGYPSFGLLGIIWFQVTLSSKFSHFKWLFLTLIVWVLIWRFGLSPEMTSVVILTEDVDFWLVLVKSVCILCLA